MFAADKPACIINYKNLNLPQHAKPVSIGKEINHDPEYRIQFTPDNKVLISFWERRPQTGLAIKDAPEKSGSVFVVLLLSRETGELLKRIEWPVMGEVLPAQKIQYGSRIYPLHSGGYVGIINRHLQVFDPSFNVIHDKVLETTKDVRYNLLVPLNGEFFSIELRGDDQITMIIDSKTFKTIERFSGVNFIIGIWEDQLLATSYSKDTREQRFFKKKIGASQWNDLGLIQGNRADAKFIYNGTIIVTDIIEQIPDRKVFWFMIENDKKSDPVFKGIGRFKPSWCVPIVAIRPNYLSDFRRALDLDGKQWIEVYDLNAQRVLFTTKKYNDIVDYAISPNGDSIVLMTKKKIEFYKVPASSGTKK